MKYNVMKFVLVLLLVSLSGCSNFSGASNGSNSGSTIVLGKMLNF